MKKKMLIYVFGESLSVLNKISMIVYFFLLNINLNIKFDFVLHLMSKNDFKTIKLSNSFL